MQMCMVHAARPAPFVFDAFPPVPVLWFWVQNSHAMRFNPVYSWSRSFIHIFNSVYFVSPNITNYKFCLRGLYNLYTYDIPDL